MITGSLQLKNGKYYAVINLKDCNGKRKLKWIATGLDEKNNKRKAEKFLSDKIKEYEAKEGLFDSEILFSEYLKQWLTEHKISIDIITFRCYEWTCNTHILPYFEEKKIKLCDLSIDDIQRYINFKFENGRVDGKGGLSPKTLKEHRQIMHKALNEAIQKKLIIQNPCEFVKMPSVPKREPTFYTQKQVTDLLTAIKDEELFSFIYITLCFGLRRSEALGIKWSSIDFERKQLTIKSTVVRYEGVVEKDKTKNEASHRTYPLNDEMLSLFDKLKSQEKTNRQMFGTEYIDNDYVFKWSSGKPYSPDYITSKFSKLLKKYGLEHIRFHDLRHTCASLLIDKNYQLKDIQEWLGHADIQTTANIYGHIDIERKKSIADSMCNLL